MTSLVDVLAAATVVLPEGVQTDPARFALALDSAQDPVATAAAIAGRLPALDAVVTPLSDLDDRVLVLNLRGRTFGADPATAFDAAEELATAFDLAAAEPDLPTGFSPDGQTALPPGVAPEREGLGDLFPWCFAPRSDALDREPWWALEKLNVPAAWAYSEERNRPSRGAGVLIAQPDTGVVVHPELAGVDAVPGYNVVSGNDDATDPLDYQVGNPGHGTGTASVVVSPETLTVAGSAPRARHMAIRAINSVIRVRQVAVAQAIDWAVGRGAEVITMSLGGIPSFALQAAVTRAVQADVIVLAAAGNCARYVVWPARYDNCIAVAATNREDRPWRGTCKGAAVDVSAPGENVLRAVVRTDANGRDVDQGQGTSFAVALTAGVAALWLAHHGRANLVARARARGETLQTMFRRLVMATARRPQNWDQFEMGAGIVDARALLEADLDRNRERATVHIVTEPRSRMAIPVRSLVTEAVGYEAAAEDAVDWYRHGPEIAYQVLRRDLAARRAGGAPSGGREGGPAASDGVPAPSTALSRAVTRPELRGGLGLPASPAAEGGDPAPAAEATQPAQPRSRTGRSGGLE